jgi:hypothetical protein
MTLLGNGMAAWKGFLAHCTAFAEFLGWSLSSVCDIVPPDVPFKAGDLLGKWILGFECATCIFSFPWFTPPFALAAWKFDQPYDPDGAANVAWLWGTLGGVALDGFIELYWGYLPENWNDMSLIISVLFAVSTLVCGGVACAGASDLDLTLQILPAVPNIIKLGRLTAIVNLTNKVSLAVVGLSDVLFGCLIVPILTSVQGNTGESSAMVVAPGGVLRSGCGVIGKSPAPLPIRSVSLQTG